MNAPNFTTAMRDNGIKYIHDNGPGFSVMLHGGAVGSGVSVGAAFQSALEHREVMARVERIAA